MGLAILVPLIVAITAWMPARSAKVGAATTFTLTLTERGTVIVVRYPAEGRNGPMCLELATDKGPMRPCWDPVAPVERVRLPNGARTIVGVLQHERNGHWAELRTRPIHLREEGH